MPTKADGDGLGVGTELVEGLRFLFGNYKPHTWYWELIEMSRKVILTSGLILVGHESRSYIGLAWVVAGVYGIHFSWMRPTGPIRKQVNDDLHCSYSCQLGYRCCEQNSSREYI